MARSIPGHQPGPTIRLVTSACFVVGFLYASVVVHRLELDPIWSPEQQLLLAMTTASRGGAMQNNPDAATIVAHNGDGDGDGDAISSPCDHQSPPVWPRSLVVVQQRIPDRDSRVGPATTVTYYDYDRGANLIQIHPEPNCGEEHDGGDCDGSETTTKKPVVWDLELNTGHSYYFVPSQKSCTAVDFPVGILRPDWLEGATPLGPSVSTWRRARANSGDFDGGGGGSDSKDDETSSGEAVANVTDRLVCGWTKVDFIDYYTDADTGLPDSWYFHTMKATFRVLNYTAIGEPSWSPDTIDPALFVPPDYCFL